jgi:uncharacterized protein (TIGR00159 family)
MGIESLLQRLTWRDALDVLLVAVVLYHLLRLIRGTRAVQMLIGILLIGVAYWLAELAGLETLGTLLERFLIVLPFAILILFQQEIRRVLANFGSNPFVHRASRQRNETVAEILSQAAAALAARHIGALLVVERLEGLRDYAEGGVRLDAELSVDLLSTVFAPGTPLHDGAVLIAEGRVAAAGCLMPLSTRQDLAVEIGTRHRAALGIVEETDAIAVVVSEETGILSLAHDGQLEQALSAGTLRGRLVSLLESTGSGRPLPSIGGRVA